MAFAPYVTTAELKTYLAYNEPPFNPILDGVVAAVTRQIDEHCQRHFWRDGATGGTEVARTFEPCHRYRLDIDDLVPGSLTTFKTDEAGDGTFETTWAASDYQLLPANRPTGRPYTRVEAIASRLFPVRWSRSGRADRVEITGVWGWPTVPDAVRQAALIQAARVFKRKDSPEGVSGFDQFGVIRVSGRMDPDVAQLLAPYQLRPVLVA